MTPHQQRGGGWVMRQNLKGEGIPEKGYKDKKSGRRELKVTGNIRQNVHVRGEKGGGGGGGYTRNSNEDRKSRGEVSCEKKSRGVIIYLFFFNFSVLL